MQVPAHFLAQNASDFSCIWGENRNLAPGGCSWGFCCLGMPNPMTGPENPGEGVLRGVPRYRFLTGPWDCTNWRTDIAVRKRKRPSRM